MLGVVLTEPVAKEAVRIGLKHGVILNAPTEKIIRLTPPLVISDEEVDRAVAALEATLSECLEATR